jgi:ketosteroid isomerase-like protein
MKTILSIAFLAVIVSIGNLACKKSDDTNSNTNTGPGNSTTAQTSPNAAQPAAADKDQALIEVTAVAREYMDAVDKGDLAALERILANDFTVRWQGKLYDKNSWLEGRKPADNVATDEMVNPVLMGYSADTATLHHDRRLTYKDGSPPYMERDSMTFVKNSGRWQLKEYIYGH